MVDVKKLMLTIPEAGRLGYLSAGAIRQLVRDGRIPSIQIGNRKLIRRTDFLSFVQGEDNATGKY